MSGEKNASLCREREEQLSFEKLLADLSVRFINVPPDHVDSEIEESLRLICKMLGIDMAALWQVSEEVHRGLITMEMCCEEPEVEIGNFSGHSGLTYLQQLSDRHGADRKGC